MIALRAQDRRAGARRPAVESAVSAGVCGRPDATLGKPASGRLPTGLPQRLGRRCAPPTDTWKTKKPVFHSSHSLDHDRERWTTLLFERRHRFEQPDRSTRTLQKLGPSLSSEPTSVRIHRNRCPQSSESAPPTTSTLTPSLSQTIRTRSVASSPVEESRVIALSLASPPQVSSRPLSTLHPALGLCATAAARLAALRGCSGWAVRTSRGW